ncbi:MAG: dihydroorotate dehydrogenase electron transfer subunit [Thermoproteota archaeon]
MDYHIEANKLRTMPIQNIKNESSTVKTFTFKDHLNAKAEPGQFLMLWIPGVDEIPLSILDTDKGDMVSVAVKKVGEATEALHHKEIGDLVGVRGPFGNNFTLQKWRVLTVSGGTGTIPIHFLLKKLASKATKITSVIGAERKEELLFIEEIEKRLSKTSMRLKVTTEDGSYGEKGLATDTLDPLLAREEFDMIYTCGPEPMLRKVFDWAEKKGIPLEASLERLMRCAVGLCGSCIVGRYRVCQDGPVFNSEQLRKISDEFGVSKLGWNGRKIPFSSNRKS